VHAHLAAVDRSEQLAEQVRTERDCASTSSVFGLITETVFEAWSAVYTRSRDEIGGAPGSLSACRT
jgi:hypothetical protein